MHLDLVRLAGHHVVTNVVQGCDCSPAQKEPKLLGQTFFFGSMTISWYNFGGSIQSTFMTLRGNGCRGKPYKAYDKAERCRHLLGRVRDVCRPCTMIEESQNKSLCLLLHDQKEDRIYPEMFVSQPWKLPKTWGARYTVATRINQHVKKRVQEMGSRNGGKKRGQGILCTSSHQKAVHA